MHDRLEETNLAGYDVESYARNSVKDLCEIISAINKCKGSSCGIHFYFMEKRKIFAQNFRKCFVAHEK